MSQKSLRLEILEKISQLVTAGFGLVAALAWNEAIQSLFRLLFPQQSEIWAKFGYALIITVLVVIITLKLGDLINKLKVQIGQENKEDGSQNQ